jgi:outer membrane receptor protein involved in Fe transport
MAGTTLDNASVLVYTSVASGPTRERTPDASSSYTRRESLEIEPVSLPRSLAQFVVLSALLLPSAAIAGTTGKVAGRVVDMATGEPLPGANVSVLGTRLGAVTDRHGEYFIINIPPGSYAVRAEMMGYAPATKPALLVVIDRTTPADFGLGERALELPVEIQVVGERPLIEKDATSKLAVVTAQDMENLPLANIDEVLSTQGGIMTDAGGAIHVRGGRADELAYMIDGMYVEDPLLGGLGSLINKYAVQEMVVLSGTFNAEYGDAMSGVVNVVTKEGGPSFSGRVEYLTPMVNSSPYRREDWIAPGSDSHRDTLTGRSDYRVPALQDEADLDIPLAGELNAYLGGPFPLIPGLSYFLSGQYRNESSYLPFGHDLRRDLLSRFSYRVSPQLKSVVSLQESRRYYQSYSHPWKYLPQHFPRGSVRMSRQGFELSHSLSARLFYTFTLSRFRQDSKLQVSDLLPGEYEERKTDANLEFYTGGDYPLYRDARTISYASKGDLTWQASGHHQLRTGFEAKQHELFLDEMTQLVRGGPFEYQIYEQRPREAGIYIQDKVEYPYLVINAGLRFDYANPRARMWENIEDPSSQLRWVPAKTQLSPRLGLAHPVTENTVLHFSYGHFFQNPTYNELYTNLGYLSVDPLLIPVEALVGNPRLEAQKTVAYEVGIQQAVGSMFALDFTAYSKDLTGLLATDQVRRYPYNYIVYTNADYGSVQGIELALRRRFAGYWSGQVNYTLQVARGNRSFPLQGFYNVYYEVPEAHKEFYLDFDRRHDLTLNVDVRLPENSGPFFFGRHPLSESGFNLLIQAASGLPYTPYVDPGLEVEENSGRMPWTMTADFRADKTFDLGTLRPTVFFEVTNLLDRRNALYVYSRTGKPWDAGKGGMENTADYIRDPSNVGAPRQVRLGVRVGI